MSVNKVILVGRLGRDPEVRYTSSGQPVANFSLATDETFRDRAGERQKRTEWHKIVVWGKSAEIAQKYLRKGSLIYLEGRIQQREYLDRDQNKRTSFDIVCNRFQMLGSRAEGAAEASGGPGPGPSEDREAPRSAPAPPTDEFSQGSEVSDEDIPF